MITVGHAIISDDVADKYFVCDLKKCKGACCVEGDVGAPLLKEELPELERIYSKVKPYLSRQGIETIERTGFYVEEEDGEYTTPTIGNNKECAYGIYDKGVLKCGIEQAYLDGKINFKKPISCHLYPIRITSYDEYDAINYERWDICNAACSHGRQLGVPVYRFLKEPLIRKYGEAWYHELCRKIENPGEQK